MNTCLKRFKAMWTVLNGSAFHWSHRCSVRFDFLYVFRNAYSLYDAVWINFSSFKIPSSWFFFLDKVCCSSDTAVHLIWKQLCTVNVSFNCVVFEVLTNLWLWSKMDYISFDPIIQAYVYFLFSITKKKSNTAVFLAFLCCPLKFK